MDADGVERYRIEGYLPKNLFFAPFGNRPGPRGIHATRNGRRRTIYAGVAEVTPTRPLPLKQYTGAA